jgi:hypothetical protein
MAAGSIVVDLLMRTGSFETDTKKAERALRRLQKEAADAGKVIGTALAAGAITAAYAFDKLVKGAADFKDLEETTGAAAEDLASLAIAADTAGVGMETLAANSIRLTKGLAGIDDESKGAGAAIAALGLNLSDFKKLDPVAQIDSLTKAFAGFADGQEKTAVATQLWGKSGAEMLKVLKALEEQGGRTKILTQEQIDAADAYADAQSKSTAELKLYAQAAATQGAPAFLALTNAASDFIKELIGVDKETGKLAQSSNVKDFAEGAVKAIAFVIDVGDGAIRVFKGMGLAIGGALAAADAALAGRFGEARRIIGELGSDLDALASKAFFSDGLAARMAAGGPQVTGPDGRPRLRPPSAASGGSGKSGSKGKDERLEAAKTERKQYLEWIDAQYQAEIDAGQEFLDADIAQSRIAADAKTLMMKQYFDFIDSEREREEEEARASAALVVKEADGFAKKFAENTQDHLGQGLYDLMTGNFKNIGDSFVQMINRMVAEAAAAQLARHLFGDMVQGGSGGGVLGSILGSIGSAFGGSFANGGFPPVGQMSLVGERGPELFVPRTAGMIIPAQQTARLMSGGQTVNQTFVIPPGTARDTQDQVASAASRGLLRARARGTA